MSIYSRIKARTIECPLKAKKSKQMNVNIRKYYSKKPHQHFLRRSHKLVTMFMQFEESLLNKPNKQCWAKISSHAEPPYDCQICTVFIK